MNCSKASQKRLLIVASLLLSFTVICLFFAEIGEHYLRHRREDAVYDTVLTAAHAHGVSPAMVLAVIRTESDFEADALSPAGAVGLMQLLPDTFTYLRDEKLNEALPDSAVWEPQVNIRYGTYYLSYLFARFGNWQAALAAYNAGESRVCEWLEDPDLSHDGKTLAHIPYPETARYVEKALAAYRDYLQKYNFKE